MASIVLSERPLASLKKLSREAFADVKSSHLSESLAAALGFRTHASLLAAVSSHPKDADIILLQEALFRKRMAQFSCVVPAGFSFEEFIEPNWKTDRKTGRPKKVNRERPDAHLSTLISTTCLNDKVEYKSTRSKAWRNMMVAGVNEALRRKLFTLRPGDNRWPRDEYGDHRFEFTLPNGMAAVCGLHDASFDEVQVFVTVEPRPGARRRYSELEPGVATGSGFVERRRGAWLQSGDSNFRGTRQIAPVLAQMEVQPLGFGDRGAVIM
ncbi:hypothetical protein [Burkholderia cenocepacia]|uniref:hypothetical protein n=1 Tax=Burkholderia cenocepacia TaxID=95486 RepID=UPI0007621DC5|nr:hypothetical protein [Burkholderia cenocepacia]KWU26429.1 hypothetical protein AS149_25925 [Burkholderia cenocepacia]